MRDVFYYGAKPNVYPTERKASDFEHAKSLATTEHFWIINEFCDYTNFDFEFDFDRLLDEDKWAIEHINIWPSQHQKDSGTWLVANTNKEQYKIYRNDVEPIKRIANINSNWKFYEDVDTNKFDFSWHPDPTEPSFIYRWGCKYYPNELQHVLEYIVPGATQVKYMDQFVELLPSKYMVQVQQVDNENFDLAWRPDPREPAFIYTWGNKYVPSVIQPTLEYHVPGSSQRKYMSDDVPVKPEWDRWFLLHDVDEDSFDFSWRPDPREPKFIYVFGNTQYSAEKMPALQYVVEGATDKKYINDLTVKLKQNPDLFEKLFDDIEFDYSWIPDPYDPPMTYVFGNQWYGPEVMPTVKYVNKKGTTIKYVHDVIATIKQRPEHFENTRLVKKFDYSWIPNPNDDPYIYQFGTQWAKTHGPRYVVKGATVVKYVEDIIAEVLPSNEHWEIPENIRVDNFDFSWHPDGTSPPYIYQFGTTTDENDGPRYITPGNDGTVIKILRKEINPTDIPRYYIDNSLDELIEKHKNELFWACRSNLNYDNFDFSWRPNKDNSYHINAFGSPESEITCTYLVNGKMIAKGHKLINFVEHDKQITEEFLVQSFKKPDMFFVDRGNKQSSERFSKLKELYPNIQRTRFLNSWVDTIVRCTKKSQTELCWILNSELVYTNFDFNYYPNPWQMSMVNVFGTQWNHWGTTYLVNCEKFEEDTKYIKIIEHLPNINHVKTRRAAITNCLYDVIVIDFNNTDINQFVDNINNKTSNKVKYTLRYCVDLYQTLLPLIEETKTDNFVWIVSTLSDYTDFDFTYVVDPFATDQLHTFPCDKQKYGDTIFVNLNLLKDLDDLSKFDKINFNETFRTRRVECPIVTLDSDTMVDSVNSEFNFPYINFVTIDNADTKVKIDEPMSFWTVQNRNIIINSIGASNCIIPYDVVSYVKDELYDYPYIITSKTCVGSRPLDIVFLSNGEKLADEHYEYLIEHTKHLDNRVVRVDGVNGRVKSYHAAAVASNTPWMFTVFAKLKINPKFDFSWQPDRLQKPKHYIFHALNPVNGLVYGHQAMIAYNKKLVLDNSGVGLDFTLDSEHEVCRINSGIAMFNTDEFSTWRTAFRETIKLSASDYPIDKVRLDVWCEKAEGNFSEYSINGAKDGVEYYNSVNGDIEKLKLSYDWPWCKQYFYNKYGNIK